VVLLHVDDDVLDLRQEIGAFGQVRVGTIAGPAPSVPSAGRDGRAAREQEPARRRGEAEGEFAP
jgi:hypothetical protein